MKNIVFLLSAAMLVSGCNTTYRRPTSPDVANLRVVSVQTDERASSLALYAHPGDTCEEAEKIVGLGGLFNFGGGRDAQRDIGMPKDPEVDYVPGRYFETSVEAGQRFHYTIVGAGPGATPCFITGSFLPQQGFEYEMSLRVEFDHCSVRLERFSTAGVGFKRSREPSNEQRLPACSFFWN
jgi:hypothetical protein